MHNPFKRKSLPDDASGPVFENGEALAPDPMAADEMRKKRRKRILAVVLIAAAALIAASALYKKSQPKLKTITTGKITYGDLTKTVSADGQVQSKNVSVVADSSGSIIQSVDVGLNNTVNRGARLCTLVDSQTGQTRAVTAPISGTITHVGAAKGNPTSGELFTIQNTGNLQIVMQIDQNDISAVSTGQAVSITADGTGGRCYTGVISSVAPTSTDLATGNADTGAALSSDTTALTSSGSASVSSGAAAPTFNATVDISHPTDGLKIGMKTSQEITVENRQNVFTVPIDAVTKDESGRYEIFVVKHHKDMPDTVESVNVETGLQNDTVIQISADGLRAGAKVALNPASLHDGQQVKE
jgi:multidrug efflux pump subunit AcrA (membrane-fusion protein)